MIADAYPSRGEGVPNVAPNPLVEAQRYGWCVRALVYDPATKKVGWFWNGERGTWTEDTTKAAIYQFTTSAEAVARYFAESELTTVPRHNGYCREWIVIRTGKSLRGEE